MVLPPSLTLDLVAELNSADQFGYRYELSPEGALSVMPLRDVEHAKIASRLAVWLLIGGLPPERVLQAVGLRIPGPDGDGGRIPDLTVWSKAPATGVWSRTADLLLAIEIVSPSSAAMDLVVKREEYARAGVPRYWVVDRDPAQTVTLLRLDGAVYVEHFKMPLAWLLNQSAAELVG